MKLFIDSADTQEIISRFETGLIDGVTTNPSLIRKSGKDPEDVYQELIDAGIQDISMEVVGSVEEMFKEGMRYLKNLVNKQLLKFLVIQMVLQFVEILELILIVRLR